MDDLTMEQLALALKVDMEELKKNYALYEKALKPFKDALEASQPTPEDYQIRVGGSECPCQNDLP